MEQNDAGLHYAVLEMTPQLQEKLGRIANQVIELLTAQCSPMESWAILDALQRALMASQNIERVETVTVPVDKKHCQA